MIEVIIDHSYADDYFMIAEINVKIEDRDEKQRIERAVDENGLIGSIGYPYADELADLLKVDRELIDIDTNEIDLMLEYYGIS